MRRARCLAQWLPVSLLSTTSSSPRQTTGATFPSPAAASPDALRTRPARSGGGKRGRRRERILHRSWAAMNTIYQGHTASCKRARRKKTTCRSRVWIRVGGASGHMRTASGEAWHGGQCCGENTWWQTMATMAGRPTCQGMTLLPIWSARTSTSSPGLRGDTFAATTLMA